MNATHDDQSDERKEPGLTQNADDEAASPGLTRNKSDGLTPGEILREGRLAHDYTVEDLCAQTKLSHHTVEALEENDFQSLSQPVFARGYYRQCAKVLDLDIDRLMAAYTEIVGDAPKPRIDHRSVGAGVIPMDVTPGAWLSFPWSVHSAAHRRGCRGGDRVRVAVQRRAGRDLGQQRQRQ